jgi:hypothetical protein
MRLFFYPDCWSEFHSGNTDLGGESFEGGTPTPSRVCTSIGQAPPQWLLQVVGIIFSSPIDSLKYTVEIIIAPPARRLQRLSRRDNLDLFR